MGLSCSPTISAAEITGKTKAEIRDLANKKGLIVNPNAQLAADGLPRKWKDPVTGKQRLRLDEGHIDKNTGLPYNNPNAAVPHVHAYEPDGVTKVVDSNTGDPHFPLSNP